MMTERDRIDETSPDMKAELLARLHALVPEAFSDGKLDLERLGELAGDAVATGPERYGLTWPGKRDAIAMLQAPSRATLVPEPDQSVNFEDAQHVFIEGENLEVLKLLYKSYFGKVKLIYIDPPYNTGNDFIYHDDFSDPLAAYLTQTGQMTEDGDMTTSAPEKAGRFHSNWLSMMYPRLSMARQMLSDDGLLMVSIDDHEVDNLKLLLGEVFGEENYVAKFVWKRKAGGGDDSDHVASEHEYIVCFARNIQEARVSTVFLESPAMTAKYNKSENGRRYYLERLDKTSLTYSAEMDFPIECPDGTFVTPPQPNPSMPSTAWRWGKSTVIDRRDELIFLKEKKTGEWRVYTKTWEPLGGITPRTLLVDKVHGRNRDGTQEIATLVGPKVFDNPKPTKMLLHLLDLAASEPDAIVMDFFAGSGSLAHAVILKNIKDQGKRRSISVQIPSQTGRLDFPTIAEIALARLRAVIAGAVKENPLLESTAEEKLGFRAFRLTATNIRRWAGTKDMTPEGYIAQMEAFADTLLPGWKPEDVIWEVALREGFPLTSKITPAGNSAPKGSWRVTDPDTDRAFTICLAEHIDLDQAKRLGLTKPDLFVCRDTALDDTVAANLALQCTLKVL